MRAMRKRHRAPKWVPKICCLVASLYQARDVEVFSGTVLLDMWQIMLEFDRKAVLF